MVIAHYVSRRSEFRAEYLNPPYMSVARPALRDMPATIPFNHAFTVPVHIPTGIGAASVQGASGGLVGWGVRARTYSDLQSH